MMRGTIHLLTRDDALTLRPVDRPVHEREIKVSQTVGSAREIDRDAFDKAVTGLLADGPVPQKALGLALAERFPATPPTQLGQLARSTHPLAQLPPRGTWKGSGGVVYQPVDAWLGGRARRARRPRARPPLPARLRPRVRRRRHCVVRGHRPGRADEGHGRPRATRGRERQGPLRRAGRPDRRRGHTGPGSAARLPTTTSGSPTPAATGSPTREAQGPAGPNGAAAAPILVDGWLEGLWRVADGRVEIVEHVPQAHEGGAVRARRGDRPGRGAPGSLGRRGPQRGVRARIAAAAATPAVEVRSTSAPEPHGVRAGARRTPSTSSSVRPPSGPTTSTTAPASGTASDAERRGRLLVQHHGQVRRRHDLDHVGGRRQLGDLRVPGPSSLLGRLAGGRAPAGQRLRGPVALPDRHAARRRPRHDPGHTDLGEHLDRELAPVTLGERLHHGDRTAPAPPPRRTTSGARRRSACRWPRPHPPPSAPRPSVSTSASPTRSRRTATAWCASSPSTRTTDPTGRRRATAPGGRAATSAVLVERVAQPAEHRLRAGLHLAGRRLLAADRGQLAQQLLLPRVEPGRRLDERP